LEMEANVKEKNTPTHPGLELKTKQGSSKTKNRSQYPLKKIVARPGRDLKGKTPPEKKI